MLITRPRCCGGSLTFNHSDKLAQKGIILKSRRFEQQSTTYVVLREPRYNTRPLPWAPALLYYNPP
jgi:hypothetical protein